MKLKSFTSYDFPDSKGISARMAARLSLKRCLRR